MLLNFAEAFLIALSLCADCFAVAVCSGINVRKARAGNVALVALSFAVIHCIFFFSGWALGGLVAGYVRKVADLIAFAILAWVGGSMIAESFSDEPAETNLIGVRNVVLSAVATSLDALGVGVSLSLSGASLGEMAVNTLVLAVVTFIIVGGGMFVGRKAGLLYGKWASRVGGAVLILIGIFFLF